MAWEEEAGPRLSCVTPFCSPHLPTLSTSGEPIASERFTVGGHEWVLLFYPDGKKSSSLAAGGVIERAAAGADRLAADAAAAQRVAQAAAAQAAAAHAAAAAAAGAVRDAAAGEPPRADRPAAQAAAAAAAERERAAAAQAQAAAANAAALAQRAAVARAAAPAAAAAAAADAAGEYAALFVALIGESDAPQGVVSTSDGRVVRAFHRFTLVDQAGGGRDLTKGRRRDQGAVKISCARADPAARNCHGYRKFVKRSVLENPAAGHLVNDTLVIRYTIELVVSHGGALARPPPPPRAPTIAVPPPTLGPDLGALLEAGTGADVAFDVGGGEGPLRAHRVVLAARSPVFAAMLTGSMAEASAHVVRLQDVQADVFHALLHFAYTDALPPALAGDALTPSAAQALLAAADRFGLVRLRAICEARLCESIDVATAATTLALADAHAASDLKRAALAFVARHLASVMSTDGYADMVARCPGLQAELLATVASGSGGGGGGGGGGAGRSRTDHTTRRVKPRTE